MLIWTGGFQSCASSFSSWCAPQVHQHKVTLWFLRGSCFFLPVFALFFSFFLLSPFCPSSKKTQNSGGRKGSISRWLFKSLMRYPSDIVIVTSEMMEIGPLCDSYTVSLVPNKLFSCSYRPFCQSWGKKTELKIRIRHCFLLLFFSFS